jgi:ATP phosphoribosyltransferase
MIMTNNYLKIAIQRKGRLSNPSKQFLASLGLKFSFDEKKLAIKCENEPVSLINVRDNDIPKYVSESIVDYGIVGLDVVEESGKKVKVKKKLNFCKCKMVIAVPANSAIKSVKDLAGKRIATSYPNILGDFLKRNGIKSKIIFVQGSVELAPYLQAADAVCDITETGRTLKEFNLTPIKTILKSQAVLIASPKTDAKQFLYKLNFSRSI